MKKPTEWLFATDITRRRRFVIHAANPYFFAEIADAAEERSESTLDSFSYNGDGYDLYNFVWFSSRPKDDAEILKMLSRATEAIRAHDGYADTVISLAGAETVGERIRAIRQNLVMSQAELAEKIDGMAQNNLSHIERDETDIRLTTLRKVAAAIGVSPKDLIGD